MDAKKILIVDDSKPICMGLADIFERDDRFEVVGMAANGIEAREAVCRLQPDVITMDVIMPVMDGLTALKHIMIETPTPTVMLSSLTLDGAETTFDALRYGALDFIPKPSRLEGAGLDDQAQDILEKVGLAAAVDVGAITFTRTPPRAVGSGPAAKETIDRAIVLGGGEGGYGALLKIVPQLRLGASAVCLAVLYVPPEHLDAFAAYLDQHSAVAVKRARHGELLEAGVCYLSSGEEYTSVHRQEGQLALHVCPAPFASRKGSVDMLMFSAAELMAESCIGVILSGSGVDGAEGLEEIIRQGGTPIVQDLEGCLDKGMPSAALARCEVNGVFASARIAATLNDLLGSSNGAHRERR